jgi:hypothetical protein
VIKYIASGSIIKQMIVFDSEKNSADYRGNNTVLLVDNIDATPLSVRGNGTIGSYTVSSAVSLLIPTDRVSGDYSGKGSSAYTTGNNYKVQIVDASATGIPKAILHYGTESLGAASIDGATPGIVTKISRGTAKVDGEDTAVSYLTVKAIDGTEKTYYESNNMDYTYLSGASSSWSLAAFPAGDGYFRGLSVGDVVKVTADEAGFIDELMLVVDADKVVDKTQAAAIAGVGDSNGSINAQYRYYLGSARAVDLSDGNDIQVTKVYANETALPDADNETYDNVSGEKVYIVDTAKATDKMVSEGQFADMVGANATNIEAANISKIFMYQTYGNIKMIVIFK